MQIKRNRNMAPLCPVCNEGLSFTGSQGADMHFTCASCKRIVIIGAFSDEILEVYKMDFEGEPENELHWVELHAEPCQEFLEQITKVVPSTSINKTEVAKARLDLVPPIAVYSIAEALTYGAEKHGLDNWRINKIDIIKRVGSALRHIFKFLAGHDIDEESGVHHLGCAMASLAVVLESLNIHSDIDNRCPMPTHKLTEHYQQ